MKLKKRAQITVFIILGMIILAVFAFLLRTTSIVQTEKLEAEAENIINELGQSQAIKHYINLCLKQSAEEALIKIGKQGGRIYDYQHGNSNFGTARYQRVFLNNKTQNISVGVQTPKLHPPYNNSYPPNLPYYPEFKNIFKKIDIESEYYLGNNILPKLCDLNGSNKDDINKDYTGSSCKLSRNAFGTNIDTIQIQLSNYTSTFVKTCIDLNFLKDEMAYNLELGTPNTKVILGEDDVRFETNFPIEINFNKSGNKKGNIITKDLEYTVVIPVRIKKIYDFLIDVYYFETNYFDFGFNDYASRKTFKKLNMTKNGLKIEKNNVPTPNNYDDLFKLIDYDSIVRGNPYEFYSIIENRPPALDYIHLESPNSPYDIAVIEGQTIRLNPIGYDPDEDYYYYNNFSPTCTVEISGKTLNCMDREYRYSGWKETEDYYFNMSCCLTQADTSTCLDNCVQNSSNSPRAWTQSDPYVFTSRQAEYKTSKKDIGYHNLTIRVCDESGLCDFQNLSIIVVDILHIIANGSNDYDDINNRYASIEDRYTLDASGVRGIISVALPPYEWCDDKEPFCINFNKSINKIPNASIVDATQPNNYFTKLGNHTLNLSVGTGALVGNSGYKIEVFECLPHRGDIAPYPFNNIVNSGNNQWSATSPDPYMGSNMCCVGDVTNTSSWKYADSNTQCYNYTSYGGYFSFDFTLFNNVATYGNNFITHDINWLNFGLKTFADLTFMSYSHPLANDIYKRYFNVTCSGNRGNICDGSEEEIIEMVQSCGDLTSAFNERCSGPDPILFGADIETDIMGSCVNYGIGDSFEKNLRDNIDSTIPLPNGDGQCTSVKKCSVDGDGGYDYVNADTLLCNALCNGNGACSYVNTNDLASCTDCRCDSPKVDAIITQPYSSTLYGKCKNGRITTCDFTSDGCIENPNSYNEVTNKFESCPGSFCKFTNYVPTNNDGVCGSTERCVEDSRNPDDYETICDLLGNRYNITTVYNSVISPSDRRCCGDDSDESINFPTTCAGISGCTAQVGCRSSTECVFNNVVYSVNDPVDITGDGFNEYCLSSSPYPIWVECNGNAHCSSNNCDVVNHKCV